MPTGKLRTNVAAELKLARTARGTRPKGLLPAEVQGLLRAAGQSRRALARRNYAVVQFLLQAGLRVSEAAALRLEDLEIRERQGKVRIRGKGNKERCVPLNATARPRSRRIWTSGRRPARKIRYSCLEPETPFPYARSNR